MAEKLMLLDSASMYFRSFYGVPDRFEAADGTPVNAVRGFVDAISTLISEFGPDQFVACWDNDWRPQFRVDLVPSYKAHRVADEAGSSGEADGSASVSPSETTGSADDEEEIPDRLEVQVPIMIAVLAAVGLARVGADGFEADDVIAQLTRNAHGPVAVVTGDRDLFQLVDPKQPVRVIYTAKGLRNLDIVDDDWLRAKYGVVGSQYADFSLMRGDSSDGLPGVVGVGEKTATKLIESYGSLPDILAAAESPETDMASGLRRKLLDSREYLSRATPVVTLNHPVQVPGGPYPLPRKAKDAAELAALAEAYDLASPVERLTQALQW